LLGPWVELIGGKNQSLKRKKGEGRREKGDREKGERVSL